MCGTIGPAKWEGLSDRRVFSGSRSHGVHILWRKILCCLMTQVDIGRSGTLAYNSFRWCAIQLFKSLPKFIRCTTSCSVYGFKHTLDSHLMNIVDHPCVPGFNNNLDGGDCIKWRTLCDDLAAAELSEVSK